MGFRGLGFRVLGCSTGFRVQGGVFFKASGLRSWGAAQVVVGFRVQGSGWGVLQGFRFKVLGGGTGFFT